MSQPQNDPAAALRNIKVAPSTPAARDLINYLSNELGASRIPNTDDLVRLLLASHLQVVNYIGTIEEQVSGLGQQ